MHESDIQLTQATLLLAKQLAAVIAGQDAEGATIEISDDTRKVASALMRQLATVSISSQTARIAETLALELAHIDGASLVTKVVSKLKSDEVVTLADSISSRLKTGRVISRSSL